MWYQHLNDLFICLVVKVNSLRMVICKVIVCWVVVLDYARLKGLLRLFNIFVCSFCEESLDVPPEFFSSSLIIIKAELEIMTEKRRYSGWMLV